MLSTHRFYLVYSCLNTSPPRYQSENENESWTLVQVGIGVVFVDGRGYSLWEDVARWPVLVP